MYFDINETIGRGDDLYKFSGSRKIVISDFFPYLNEDCIPEVPMSGLYNREVFGLFRSVGTFERFDVDYTEPILEGGYCVEDDFNYDFNMNIDDYESTLNKYVETLARIGYEVEVRPVEELYTSFIEVQKVCSVSGLVNIDAKTLFASSEMPAVKITEMYDRNMPTFESYYISVNEFLPFLAMTLNTLLEMHKQLYINRGFELNEPNWKVDIIPFNYPLVSDRVNVVTDIVIKTVGDYKMSSKYIEELLSGNNRESLFREYFSEMNYRFGLIESEAIHALTYFDTVVRDYRVNFYKVFNLSEAQLKGRKLYLIPEKNVERYKTQSNLKGLI